MLAEKIIKDLSKTPIELEETKKQKIWRYCKYPFNVCTTLVRVPSMFFIVPASWFNLNDTETDDEINSLNQRDFTLQRINYSIPRNNRCAIEVAINNKNIDTRTLVIFFGGNGMIAQHGILDFLQSNPKQLKDRKCDFLAVDWPSYVTTSEQLVDAGVSAVVRAIKAG